MPGTVEVTSAHTCYSKCHKNDVHVCNMHIETYSRLTQITHKNAVVRLSTLFSYLPCDKNMYICSSGSSQGPDQGFVNRKEGRNDWRMNQISCNEITCTYFHQPNLNHNIIFQTGGLN